MQETAASIGEKLATLLVKQGKTKLMWSYCVVSHLTAGRGYEIKSKLITRFAEFVDCTERTAREHINKLRDEGFVEESIDKHTKPVEYLKTIRVKSRKRIAADLDAYCKRKIKFTKERLKDYSKFRDLYIRSTHKLLQSRLRYCFNHIKKGTESLLQIGKIDQGSTPSSIDKVGCSIRKVCEYTNMSYRTVQKALVGYTKRVYNNLYFFKNYHLFRKVFDMSFFLYNPKYSFAKRPDGSIVVRYALGSISSGGTIPNQ